MVEKLLRLLFLFGALNSIFVSAKVIETEDAIIVEGKNLTLIFVIMKKKYLKIISKAV